MALRRRHGGSEIAEFGRFPREPYAIVVDGPRIQRAPEATRGHRADKDRLHRELAERLANAPSREVLLYVHGFNETFESAAYTTAELCHFLGREDVCTFFTWGRFDMIIQQGKRTDAFGHSFFTSNPRVSSDLVQLIRFGKRPGDPERPLRQVGPVTWVFEEQELRAAAETSGL